MHKNTADQRGTGENADALGLVYFFNLATDRNKYFSDDGSLTDLGKAAIEKVKAVDQELEKIVTFDT
jgi:hypothetical protein